MQHECCFREHLLLHARENQCLASEAAGHFAAQVELVVKKHYLFTYKDIQISILPSLESFLLRVCNEQVFVS